MSSMETVIEGMRKDISYMREKMDEFVSDHHAMDARIRKLEDWKLQFVAEFTAYTTIALFVGSFLAQIVLSWVGKYI